MKKDSIETKLVGMEEVSWPMWSKGERTRLLIIELLKQIPNPSIKQVAQSAGISIRQARRQRETLVASGVWKLFGYVIALSAGFLAGAYYANPENREIVDEWIECRIKSPIHQIGEEILWNLEEFL